MRFTSFRRAALQLAVASLVGGAWILHVVEAHHGLADNDCQTCIAACSPELNADCGTVLLSKPLVFTVVDAASGLTPVAGIYTPAFQGRAPPLA